MDGRLSSNSLKENLIKGIISVGVDVIDIGKFPTPLLYFSLHSLKVPNGVMITGSHNPKDHNGIKIVLNWETLFDTHISELKTIILEEKFSNSMKKTGFCIQYENILEEFTLQ